jgi:hypothetical protein
MNQIISTFTGILNVTPTMILESERNNGKLLVQGILQRADAENQNERVYPKQLLEREIDKFQNKINEGLSGGELDHPDSNIVNLKNVSHKINKVWWSGNDVVGIIEILDTPAGKIAKELIKGGIQLGISSRGMGSTSVVEGKTTVNEDFDLITWDLVSEPSTHKAFLYPMKENINRDDEIQKMKDIDEIILKMMEIKL